LNGYARGQPIVGNLSCGYDSRFVLGLAAPLRKRILKRYSAGYRLFYGACALLVLGAGVSFGLGQSRGPDPVRLDGPVGPKLIVLVFFDQMRGDFLSRWQDAFVKNGFRRLMEQGAWFRNCHYPYAATVTAAGHASVSTGCTPSVHGIVGNEWYDREARTRVGCVASGRWDRVPAFNKTGSADRKHEPQASPERLLTDTFADALREASGGQSRVISLSLTGRAATLPAGKRPDACYWFDTADGRFVTSSYYRDAPHSWVAEYNGSRRADNWFSVRWERFRPELDYGRYSGPDDVPGEGTGYKQGRTFPHPMDAGEQEPGPHYYGVLCNSPYGNEMLLELADRAITAEGLGQGPGSDFLSISFSANDYIGHCWGPDSQEAFDVTLRSDEIMRRLLDTLDLRIGTQRYIVAVTADHGVCPLPEVARSQGKDSGRVDLNRLKGRAEAFLKETLGAPAPGHRWLEAQAEDWLYLDIATIQKQRLTDKEVQDVLDG